MKKKSKNNKTQVTCNCKNCDTHPFGKFENMPVGETWLYVSQLKSIQNDWVKRGIIS